MSATNLRSHGVYDNDTPASLSIKTYFAGFQYCEFTSGVVAAPTSPIPPARASGAIDNDGTAVIIGLFSI